MRREQSPKRPVRASDPHSAGSLSKHPLGLTRRLMRSQHRPRVRLDRYGSSSFGLYRDRNAAAFQVDPRTTPISRMQPHDHHALERGRLIRDSAVRYLDGETVRILPGHAKASELTGQLVSVVSSWT